MVTKVHFWKIEHNTKPAEISLKIARYPVDEDGNEGKAKDQGITLTPDELIALQNALRQNLGPLKAGASKWVSIDDAADSEQVEALRALFADPDKRKVVEFLNRSNVLPDDLLNSIEYSRRCRAVEELERMLGENLTEAPWQSWFEVNDWVLGTEFVRVLDERSIDVKNISDYLMEAYDGFLDLVEIKRPEGGLKFWADGLDHGNYVPHSDLVKAITQASTYIYELEMEANSVKTTKRLGVRAIKPRCVLIFGRSRQWKDGQREAYRILNAGYHNLSILTFDHVLARAKRMLNLDAENGREPAAVAEVAGNDFPF